MFDFSKIVKFGSDGLVDQNATLETFATALGEYAALQKSDSEATSKAVAAVVEKNPVQSVFTLDSLATLAALEMGAGAGDLATLTERCKDHIRHTPALYKIAKGRNGGVQIVARMKPAASA